MLFPPLDLSLQDPALCDVCGQLSFDRLRKGKMLRSLLIPCIVCVYVFRKAESFSFLSFLRSRRTICERRLRRSWRQSSLIWSLVVKFAKVLLKMNVEKAISSVFTSANSFV